MPQHALHSGGTATATLVSGAGATALVESGGVVSTTTVRSGGVETVAGIDRNGTIGNSGTQVVSATGAANGSATWP